MPNFQIVVNADDFGKSHEVNVAVIQAFREKLINRTTLMTNMPFFDEAVSMAKEEKITEHVGLHLNLTEGMPLKGAAVSVLCDEQGQLCKKYHLNLWTRFFLPEAAQKAVYAEAEAQMQKFLKTGFPLRHMDSHHHVHTDIAVLRVIAPLIRKYQFISIRLGRNIFSGKDSLANRLYKTMLNAYIFRISGMKKDSAVPSRFGTQKDYSSLFETEQEKNGFYEIMVHPIMSQTGVLIDALDSEIQTQKWLSER